MLSNDLCVTIHLLCGATPSLQNAGKKSVFLQEEKNCNYTTEQKQEGCFSAEKKIAKQGKNFSCYRGLTNINTQKH